MKKEEQALVRAIFTSEINKVLKQAIIDNNTEIITACNTLIQTYITDLEQHSVITTEVMH